MKYHFVRWASVLAAGALLAGCATAPAPIIDKTKFAQPKSVAIVEPPRMRNYVVVGGVFPKWDYYVHFSSRADEAFVLDSIAADVTKPRKVPDYQTQINEQQIQRIAMQPPQPVGTAAAGGAVAGAMGALIQSSAEDTAKKAVNFDEEVLKRVPGLDIRADLITAISQSLAARGIATTVITDSNTFAPRLRWPGPVGDQHAFDGLPAWTRPSPETLAGGELPVVNADILLQLSPIAAWTSPGPMNNFRRSVTVGIAAFDGRTKQFLGRQTFLFDPPTWQKEYMLYDSLVDSSVEASTAMRDAVLSLVPQIVDAISTKQNVKGG